MKLKIKKKMMRYKKLATTNEEISILPLHKPTVYQKKRKDKHTNNDHKKTPKRQIIQI